MLKCRFVLVIIILVFIASESQAYFIDGDGYYAVRPEALTNPGAMTDRGQFQATRQSFRLLMEARANDKLSGFVQFRLFENERTAYLGDTSKPRDCSKQEPAPNTEDGEERNQNNNRGNESDCTGRHQDSGEPAFADLQPRVSEVYGSYAFDYCKLHAGRKSRDWGMGVLLDSGRDPFESSASIFDGIGCAVNVQKNQTLGFSFGIDRLAETGANIDAGLPSEEDQSVYGPLRTSDDLDQIYVSVEYDDRNASMSRNFARQIGIYVSNVFGAERFGDSDSKAKTDVKFADLYTGFYFYNFQLRNELIFRLGKSADPSWARYGGSSSEVGGELVRNDVNSIGLAGEFKYIVAHSGSTQGPSEYNEGTAMSHSILLQYAHAPGDRGGYYSEYTQSGFRERNSARDKKASAMAFHRNYKPALIMFNAPAEMDDTRVDGVYDPGRFMNATLVALGYQFDSLQYGDIEAKFITAQLNVGISSEVKNDLSNDEQDAIDRENAPKKRPVGFSGKHMGYELDLKYNKGIGRDLDAGVAAGALIPGPAWRTSRDSAEMSYMLQGTLTFKF